MPGGSTWKASCLFELAPVPDNIDAEPDYPAIRSLTGLNCWPWKGNARSLCNRSSLERICQAISRLTTLDSSAFEDMGSEQLVENEAMVQPPIADGDRVIMAGMLADRKKTTRSMN